jgi:hypothetical protein
MEWAADALQLLVDSEGVLSQSESTFYIRFHRLALCYDLSAVATYVRTKWLSLVHLRVLSPIPPLCVAYNKGFRHSFGHAAYAYMVEMESILASGQNIDSPSLPPEIWSHIYNGYHSFVITWEHLANTPLSFRIVPECMQHSLCIDVWSRTWSLAVRGYFVHPKCDVLRRLLALQQTADSDPYLQTNMTVGCREAALRAVTMKREEISSHIYHYFDF